MLNKLTDLCSKKKDFKFEPVNFCFCSTLYIVSISTFVTHCQNETYWVRILLNDFRLYAVMTLYKLDIRWFDSPVHVTPKWSTIFLRILLSSWEYLDSKKGSSSEWSGYQVHYKPFFSNFIFSLFQVFILLRFYPFFHLVHSSLRIKYCQRSILHTSKVHDSWSTLPIDCHTWKGHPRLCSATCIALPWYP